MAVEPMAWVSREGVHECLNAAIPLLQPGDRPDNMEPIREALAELRVLKFALDEHADVTVTDAQGRIIYANDRFCQISGYSREELIGGDHRLIKSGVHSPAFYQDMYATIGRGRTWRGEICNRAKDGSLYWVRTTIVPLRNAAGEIDRYVAIRTDITECKRFEVLLREVNDHLERKIQELDEFSYVASHDLNEPLRKLIAFSELLAKDVGPDLPPNAARDLNAIVNSAQRMRTLIDNLLALSRAGKNAFHCEPVALAECADAALQSLAARIEDTHATITRDELPELLGDRTLITQLYQNLIGNALKFKRLDTSPAVHLSAEARNGGWVLGVRDNGIGIKPEYCQQIFAPFKRLHGRNEYEGTGIGLAICARAVERHGGRIWVESELGQGSHFRFTLANLREDGDGRWVDAACGDSAGRGRPGGPGAVPPGTPG